MFHYDDDDGRRQTVPPKERTPEAMRWLDRRAFRSGFRGAFQRHVKRRRRRTSARWSIGGLPILLLAVEPSPSAPIGIASHRPPPLILRRCRRGGVGLEAAWCHNKVATRLTRHGSDGRRRRRPRQAVGPAVSFSGARFPLSRPLLLPLRFSHSISQLAPLHRSVISRLREN